jgi:hypothetical protein
LADGAKYDGQWKYGLKHGKGVLIGSGGTIEHEGEWRDGAPHRASQRGEGAPAGAPKAASRSEAEGQRGTHPDFGCQQGDCTSGKGVFTWADGQ